MKHLLAAAALTLILTGPAAYAADTTAAPATTQAKTSGTTTPKTAQNAAPANASTAQSNNTDTTSTTAASATTSGAPAPTTASMNASGTDPAALTSEETVNGATEVTKTPTMSCKDDVVLSEAITDLQTAERQLNKANTNKQHDQVLKDIKKALSDLESSLN